MVSRNADFFPRRDGIPEVPMHTTPLPEIEEAELKAVREFLVSFRDEQRPAKAPRIVPDVKGGVTLRNGISRARHRSARIQD